LIALLFLPNFIGDSIVQKIIIRTLMISFIVNLYLNQVFYSSLLHYQAGSEAAMWINQNNSKKLPVVQINDDFVSAMNFYIDQPITAINADGTGQNLTGTYLLYAPATVINELNNKGWHIQPIKIFKRYWVSRLKPSFLNRATRAKELTDVQVAVVNPQ
jgi:hypothetical protein